jgi:hypothetical protein
VDRDEGILEVSVHDEVGIRQPDVTVVMDGVEKVVRGLVEILETRVVPLLLEEKFHLVFLK